VSVGSEYMYGSPFERRKWLKAKQNPNTSNGGVIPDDFYSRYAGLGIDTD
jgi:hypothetical protein